ncbi:MAG: hypothetical protein CL910_08665, partial [Deltaproteobacteria bacterium]|nr:hypothetical protein [Deltaproteobacteria bacterium]
MTDRTREGVELPAGVAGSRLLFEQLRRVADGAEGAYAEALPADSRAFRKDYGEALARFEAVRAGRPDRTAHAVTLARSGEAALVFAGTDGDCSLAEALAAPADALRLETQRFPGAGGLLPALPLSEPRFGADGVESAVGQLLDEGRLTESAAGAIGWSLDRARTDGGELDLRGEQFAILGAAAELAPTKLLLEAGARVLWIDRVAPPAGLEKESGLSGELCWVGDGADLLTQPAEISQTVAAFAGDSPVHLGLYAYAPGAAREWRLAVAMNAIADATPATVASISMLISPTSPAVLEPEDRQAARARREERPLWQSALDAMARFPEGVYECGELAVPRSLVSIQGTAYQAAQYLAKRLPAEAWLAEGLGGRRIAVSANVAPISHTRS